MSYEITIKGIPDKSLGEFWAKLQIMLPRGATLAPPNWRTEAVAQITGPKKKRPTEDSRLTMTGKRPTAGSKLEKYLVHFEKCEGRLGIGAVTTGNLVEYLNKRNLDGQAIKARLVTEKYLEYL